MQETTSVVNWQAMFNIAFSLAGVLGGIVMKSILDSLKELRTQDKELTDKVQSLAVTLPESYVQKADFKEFMDVVMKKLDRIEDKMDAKADR